MDTRVRRARGMVAVLITVALAFGIVVAVEEPSGARRTQARTISATLAGTGTVSLGSGSTVVDVTSSGRVRGAPRANFSTYSLAWSVGEAAQGFASGGGITLQRRDGSTLEGFMFQDGVAYPSLDGTVTITGGTGRFLHATGTLAISFGFDAPTPPPPTPLVTTSGGSISGTFTF